MLICEMAAPSWLLLAGVTGWIFKGEKRPQSLQIVVGVLFVSPGSKARHLSNLFC